MKIRTILQPLLILLLCCLTALAQTSLPGLQMTSSNSVGTVLWPLTGYDQILQTTTDLSPAGTWTNLAAADPMIVSYTFPENGGHASYATPIGNQLAFYLPATNGQQFFRLTPPQIIPACGFAIFYNGPLEFSYCAPMVINGRVHANGPIYVGTTTDLIFNAPVTTTSDLAAPDLDGATSVNWDPALPSTWNVTFNGNPSCITNVPSLGFSLSDTNNYHFLIDIPTSSQTGPLYANNLTNSVMLYNQAEMVLVVSNSPSGTNPAVQLTLQTGYGPMVPGADPSPVILYYTNASSTFLNTNLPFLNLTNRFYDQRESKTNFVTQIDVGQFGNWVSTNFMVQGKLPSFAGVYPTIFYVADQRNVNTNQLAVVRLVNGAQLPANGGYGFTVATPNPLYVQGNYNVTTSAGTSTGVTNTNEVPAALFSDALTLLSPNWTDRESYLTFAIGNLIFNASTMTVNAAIVTGTMPSTGTTTSTYSGGVHNLPRLLEDWMAVNLYLNTSIIRLWTSQMATNQWKYQGTYYFPPNRWFSFDQNFLNPAKIPPGIPMFD